MPSLTHALYRESETYMLHLVSSELLFCIIGFALLVLLYKPAKKVMAAMSLACQLLNLRITRTSRSLDNPRIGIPAAHTS